MIAIAGIAFFGSVSHALGSPLFESADEIGHVDYAYQVWHGSLPDFWEGPVIDQSRGAAMPVQWVSQHPPLFYAVLAPIVGPLIDSGHMLIAGAAARGVNCLLASLVVLVACWGGRRAFPNARIYALAPGLLLAASPWLHNVSGAVYNDTLAMLGVTVVIAVSLDILRNGSSSRSWSLIGLGIVIAFSTRLSAGLIGIVPLGVLTVECLIFGKGRGRFGRFSDLLYSFLCGVTVVLTIGWFYLRNVHLTGSITGGHPEWSQEHLGRTERTIGSLVADPDTWPQLLNIFGPSKGGPSIWVSFVLLLVVPVILSVLIVAWHKNSGPMSQNVVGGLLVVAVILSIAAMQLKYSAGGGALNPRYFLPGALPLCIAASAGFMQLKHRIGGVLLGCWIGIWTLAYGYQQFLVPSVPLRSTFPVFGWASDATFIVMLAVAILVPFWMGRIQSRLETDA